MSLVALGSAAGGLLRWGVGMAAGRWLGTAFPYGTMIINISGSLFLGWFLTLVGERLQLGEHAWLRQDDLRLLVAVGFTGAYTTFSTFEWEASSLFRDGEGLAATLYLVGSVALGLLAVRLGVALARVG
jgi:CrcB protein